MRQLRKSLKRHKICDMLDNLIEKSVLILREAKDKLNNLAVLWSGGKDSTVMLALCREAFFNRVPFPVIHIDNGIDFPETYAFRDELAKKWGLKVLTAKSIIKKDKISGVSCCGANKTEALKELIKKEKFDGLIMGIRRDEHGIRAKERIFSPRDKKWKWDYKNQPLEIWGHHSVDEEADHHRIHPILHWREIDVWQYIYENDVPINPLYFSRDGERFRSLGCTKCTVAIKSEAKTIPAILKELGNTRLSERMGRAQDKEARAVMERLRALGYM
ncbi:MAG: Sulfate adenylyltransferase subunit 2 [Parcubacteria group bacterium GW2011_GWA2_45_30]|nr:MAG: Sulfate adenylyltransferase subunit 2 [Parcubacteria group bacterium GW2011_GWA2_45_30]